MARIVQWPLSHWETYNRDALWLSEPRSNGVAYTRGYRTQAGILDIEERTLTEWTLPHSLFPDAVNSTGHPLEVWLNTVSRHDKFLAMAAGPSSNAIVTLFPATNRVQVHTLPRASPAGSPIAMVRVTRKGTVWYVGRSEGEERSSIVIGRMRPGDDSFEYWAPKLGFGPPRSLAVEGEGTAIWTTCSVRNGDFRHALVRLDPAANEIKYWALPQADATANNAAYVNARLHGPVVVTPAARGGTRAVWWLMTSPRSGENGRLVRVDPVTGEALDFGPAGVAAPPAPGNPLSLTLDSGRRPWLTFGRGQMGSPVGDCEEAIQLAVKTLAVKPKKVGVRVETVAIQPTVTTVSPAEFATEATGDACFKTTPFLAGEHAFQVVADGLPLAERGSPMFVSNGVDAILQFRP